MDVYFCGLCKKTIKLKIKKKKHIYNRSHTVFSESIFNKFRDENPELVKIDEILKKHINNYNRRFEVFEIVYK